MRATRLLYVAILAGLLFSMIAIPVWAEDEAIPMWVSRVRLAYNGRSSMGPDRVTAMIHVRDANLATVEGAEVTVVWTLPGGEVLEQSADTEFQGIAWFEQWVGRGEYQVCVTDVVKDGWSYDPELNLETCAVFIVP